MQTLSRLKYNIVEEMENGETHVYHGFTSEKQANNEARKLAHYIKGKVSVQDSGGFIYSQYIGGRND